MNVHHDKNSHTNTHERVHIIWTMNGMPNKMCRTTVKLRCVRVAQVEQINWEHIRLIYTVYYANKCCITHIHASTMAVIKGYNS